MQRLDLGCARRRGFSLVELLIVILIIAVIIAIVIPALGGARRAAKDAATRNLITNLNQSCSSFILSERRLPGYFSPAEMGATDNEARQFSGMQNVMLELAGGLLSDDAPTATGDLTVGPSSNAANNVRVRPSLVGIASGSNKTYFTPDAKYFRRQNGVDGGLRGGAADHANLPELVDGDGMPILMWPIDPTAIDRVSASAPVVPFARRNSGNPAGSTKARAYWATNAAFLAGTAVGHKRRDQVNGSLLGPNADAELTAALTALTGSPNDSNGVDQAVQDILPNSARGQFVIHAPGADGYYLGINDKGARQKGADPLYYGLNFKLAGAGAGSTGHVDAQGKSTNVDVITKFDDIVSAGGG